MQRLFLMFPDGAPGVALVLLRGVVSLHLLGLPPLFNVIASDERVLLAMAGVPIIALVLGACTPLASGCTAALSVLSMIATQDTALLPATLSSVALLLLGPGAYSIDARRFGRRRWAPSRGTLPDD